MPPRSEDRTLLDAPMARKQKSVKKELSRKLHQNNLVRQQFCFIPREIIRLCALWHLFKEQALATV
jgi:hypothetical protein